MKKILSIGVILLFIGIAVAPCINQNVVIASIDDDLVEVTTQACGIQGYGNTTVKLTREQYQNLESYLVEFRARLNQTSTREEAVPLFKDVVVELEKYGLLPNGLGVERAQKLVTNLFQNQNTLMYQKKLLQNHLSAQGNNSNFLCLITGQTGNTTFENIGGVFFGIIMDNTHKMGLGVFSIWMYMFFTLLCWINPVAMVNRINLGYFYYGDYGNYPVQALGWVTTYGLLGVKNFQGNLQGALPLEGTTWMEGGPGGYASTKYPAVAGFVGIKIGESRGDLMYGKDFFYIGSALWTEISTTN